MTPEGRWAYLMNLKRGPEEVSDKSRDSLGEKRTFSGLLVYNRENLYTNPTNKSLLCWIIAETPAAVRMGRYMVLLVYKMGMNIKAPIWRVKLEPA